MFDKLKGRFDDQSSNPSKDDKTYRMSYDTDRSSKLAQHSTSYAAPSEQAAPPSYVLANAASPARTHFACVSLHMSDRIRLLQLPQQQCDAIRDSVLRHWPRGIQREREYAGSWEIKLNGNPWTPYSDDAIHARRLTRGILSTLHDSGWILYVTTDVSRKTDDKDNLFFRHQLPAPTPREWFSVTFSKGDRLRLIDAPRPLIETILGIMKPHTQSHEPYRVAGVYEIKLNGYPFQASGSSTMVSRLICLDLFSAFEQHGYTVSASMDQKYGGEHAMETDTWHVSRPVGWTPEMPVYHS